MLTVVGVPLVKIASAVGTVGLEFQLAPVVHSLPGPVQVPTCARGDPGVATDRAPSTAANLYGLIATSSPQRPWAVASHGTTAGGNRSLLLRQHAHALEVVALDPILLPVGRGVARAVEIERGHAKAFHH